LIFESYCCNCERIIQNESDARIRKRDGIKLRRELQDEIKKKTPSKICSECEANLNITNFCWNHNNRNYDNVCRRCKRNKGKRIYRKTKEGKAKIRIYNHSNKARSSRLIYKTRNHKTILDPDHLEWAQEIYKKESYKCQRCGKRGKLNAHHILSKARVPHLKYNPNNGICLCEECHIQFHVAHGKITTSQDLFEFMEWEWSK
jgi:hypothetical protein